jgi:hypothetical protein
MRKGLISSCRFVGNEWMSGETNSFNLSNGKTVNSSSALTPYSGHSEFVKIRFDKKD